MLKQFKTIFQEQERPPAEPKLYENKDGKNLHTLLCECGGCTIRPRTYRRAIKELNRE